MNQIDPAALRAAIAETVAASRSTGTSAVLLLAERFSADEETITRLLANELGLDFLPNDEVHAFRLRADAIEPESGLKRGVLHGVLRDCEQLLLSNPLDHIAVQWAEHRVGKRLPLGVVTKAALQRFAAANGADGERVLRSNEAPLSKAASEHGLPRNPVIDFVDRVLSDGWSAQASDVHFESTRSAIVVKFRLDGILIEQRQHHTALPQEEIVSRIKVMADLDIAERRVPQDGRFSATLGGRAVDCRISVVPSANGEDVVVRILDKRHLLSAEESLSLTGLGFDAHLSKAIRDLALRPHGMLLVTGPTGSGKTTTLYALLSEIRSGHEKIVTIEDPIEYELPGVLQVPVNEKKGLTFARGLRSILRHDPDLIMVGEIRDRETAEIAIQSALTGHVVLTTVHANNAIDVVSRFTHMGVDLYALVSSLNGVLAQRLLRLKCPHCSVRSEAVEKRPQSDEIGCDRCRHTGYLGRTAIGEVLVLDDGLRDLLLARTAVSNVNEYVRQRQTRSLTSEGRALVASGQTTEEEVRRVVGA